MAVGREGDDGGPRRRKAGKSAGRREAAAGGKEKATFRLSTKARRKISVHAAMTGQDGSAVVEALVTSHLNRWRVSDMEAGDEPDQPGEADAAAA